MIEPIWKTESVVASTPVGVLSTPAACVDDLAAGEDRYSRARDVVLLDQRRQLLGDPRLDLGQSAHAAHRKDERSRLCSSDPTSWTGRPRPTRRSLSVRGGPPRSAMWPVEIPRPAAERLRSRVAYSVKKST